MSVVWSFGFDEVAGYIVDREILDGNPEKIEYEDTTPDKGVNPLFKPGRSYAGRAVKSANVPTKIKWKSRKHPPYDVFRTRGLIVVSETFKKIIEKHEPSVHQFFPIEIVFDDNSHARQMYFFNICNRLDTMDKERTTARFDRVLWDPSTGEFVFSKKKIGNRQAWRDKFLDYGLFLSDDVKIDLERSGLTGIAFHSFPAF
ncbi:DUF1629 domain-containing protein [uncultured Roseibium sp.]|uniref:imm11 family protein n=1 Tax=uncultured Roseibium sp. TaxID=1936171 RepID=UPI002629E2F9|nr:DUF1629 domain-containing protein [uncultured Roseibium sp.]